ncbi:MAG: hypothetical protein GTN78_01780, partial [Gemmatimonadales bacterium]|nr:hypothetical protein [Gemmatimonadales bacterium]
MVDTTVGLDYVEIYALVPADGFEVALELVGDAVRNAAFSPREVERERAEARQAVRASRQDPFQETYLAFREGMYGDHPYGRLTLGAPSSLASIAREDAVRFHRDHYRANRAVLAICGGIGRTRSLRATRKAFGGW